MHISTTPRQSLTALAGGIVLAAASFGPAAAWNPFQSLFGRGSPPQQEQAPAPQAVPTPSKAQAAQGTGAASSGGMPATAMLPPKRPAPRPTEASAPPPAASPMPAAAPARTAAPAPVKAVVPPPPVAAPIVTAAAPETMLAPAAPAGPLTERQIVERANAYFNGITSLVGDFTQLGGDGRRLTGKLYMQRPGKIRFEYDPPATLEVIADGSSVAVRDRKLATQDLYTIGQTPLKFLLRERMDLGRDLRITEVAAENEGARISAEDKSTLGGTSKITLYFDKEIGALHRWRIIDPQGFQTTVTLANLERNQPVDQKLFTIDYQRILNDKP